MNDVLADNIAKAIHAVLRGCKVPDAVAVSEKLVAAVSLMIDMNTNEDGIADIPHELVENFRPIEQVDPRRVTVAGPPVPPRAVVSVQPLDRPKAVRSRSGLILPNDPEFVMPGKADERARESAIAAPTLIRRPTRPPSNAPEIAHWSPGDLIAQIEAGTPSDLVVDVARADGLESRIPIKRNILNQAGLGTVILTYRHESVGAQDGYLTAKVMFNVYQKEIDLGEAMKSIQQQLAGMYIDRTGAAMEPNGGPDPGPLRGPGSAAMVADHSMRIDSGAPVVANPRDTIMREIAASNKALTPAGRGF